MRKQKTIKEAQKPTSNRDYMITEINEGDETPFHND